MLIYLFPFAAPELVIFLDRYTFHMVGKDVERPFNSLQLLPFLFGLFDILSDLVYRSGQGKWWNTIPEDEIRSCCYESIYYWQIGPKLGEIEKISNRVKIDVIGQSAEGRNLFLAKVSAPETMGRLGWYQAIRSKWGHRAELAYDW